MEIKRKIQSILVGDNGSSESESAVAFAFSLASCFQAKLVLLGVVTAFTPEQQAEGFGLEKTEAAHTRMKSRIEQAAADGREQGLEITVDLVKGDTEKEIERFVSDHTVDLLVIGHHDKAPLRRLLEGSTPDELARRLEISILIVHAG